MEDNSYKKYRIVMKSGHSIDVSARMVSVTRFEDPPHKVVNVRFQNPDHAIYIEDLDGNEVAAVVRFLT